MIGGIAFALKIHCLEFLRHPVSISDQKSPKHSPNAICITIDTTILIHYLKKLSKSRLSKYPKNIKTSYLNKSLWAPISSFSIISPFTRFNLEWTICYKLFVIIKMVWITFYNASLVWSSWQFHPKHLLFGYLSTRRSKDYFSIFILHSKNLEAPWRSVKNGSTYTFLKYGILSYLIACIIFKCSHVFNVLFRQNSSHPNKMNPFRHIYAGFPSNYFGIRIFWCIGPLKLI